MTSSTLWDTYHGLLNQKFSINYNPEEPPLEVKLLEVTKQRELGGDFIAFSVVFGSGLNTGHLPQGTWALEHPEFGKKEVFLVPNGPDDGYFRYTGNYSYKKKTEDE